MDTDGAGARTTLQDVERYRRAAARGAAPLRTNAVFAAIVFASFALQDVPNGPGRLVARVVVLGVAFALLMATTRPAWAARVGLRAGARSTTGTTLVAIAAGLALFIVGYAVAGSLVPGPLPYTVTGPVVAAGSFGLAVAVGRRAGAGAR